MRTNLQPYLFYTIIAFLFYSFIYFYIYYYKLQQKHWRTNNKIFILIFINIRIKNIYLLIQSVRID